MKKPVLATLGVAGACAACCAIPLAIPLMSGLSVAGLASIDWNWVQVRGEVAAVGAGLAASLLVGAGLWWHRGRKVAAHCAGPALPAAAGGGCGCSNLSKEST